MNFKNLNYNRLKEELIKSGIQIKRAEYFCSLVKEDVEDFPDIWADNKLSQWALKRGFLPGRICLYGLTQQNYTDYLSDFEYYISFPYNNHFSIWINDKLTLKYMMNRDLFGNFLPEYYLYIENDGHYTFLMDIPEGIRRGEGFLFRLLQGEKNLVVKPSNGTGGKGFTHLQYENGQIVENGSIITKSQLEENDYRGCIVTEFVEQHHEMANIWPVGAHALRIVMYKDIEENQYSEPKYHCLSAFARFGTEKSHGASNLTSGGVGVNLNWETGILEGDFYGYKKFWNSSMKKHPDTHIAAEGMKVPNFEYLKKRVLETCRYFSSLDYLGFDIIITEEGMRLCEINSFPAQIGSQMIGGGWLCNASARSFFGSKHKVEKQNLEDCIKACLVE